jgi:hypothetical protein
VEALRDVQDRTMVGMTSCDGVTWFMIIGQMQDVAAPPQLFGIR